MPSAGPDFSPLFDIILSMPRESRSKTAAAKVAAPGADVIAPTDDPRLAKQTAVSVAKSKVGKGKQVPGAQAEESGRDKAQVASTPLALAGLFSSHQIWLALY